MRLPSAFRSLASLAGLLAVTAALLVAPATAASAAGEEADFVSRLNGARAAAGLPRLGAAGDLTSVARSHSERMGRANDLFHNPSLTSQVGNWSSIGENVGYGGSVLTVHNALMNSTAHRDNILSRVYTEVGVGTWIAPTGRVWVTQVFRKPIVASIPVSAPMAGTAAAYAGVLGAPTSYEYAVPGGIAQDFQGGDVYYSAATGARVVIGAIRAEYRALAGPRSALGLPSTDETATPRRFGRYNHFQGGSIYWTPATGAREVRGAIRGTWARLGWENSGLGFPTTKELSTPDRVGRFNHFEGGSIYWTPTTGAREVRGQIRGLWAHLGWESSALGYPTTDELGTPDRVGRFNHFTRASIYWTPATGAHEVRGTIRDRWASLGWERSRLGYPVSDEYDVPGGRRSDFQGGSISWDARTGATTVR